MYNNYFTTVYCMCIIATIIAGRESTGKTSALKTVISAMNYKDGGQSDCMTIKLQTIYPGVFNNVSDMLGCYDDSNNWRDGLFTSFMRKSIKVLIIIKVIH